MRTTRGLVIEPSGKCRLVDLPSSGSEGGLSARQGIVGGLIEAVQCDEDWHIWINEDGKYTFGSDGYNGLATDLVRRWLMFPDWIAGPALVVGTKLDMDADVPERIVRRVRAFPDARFIGESDVQAAT